MTQLKKMKTLYRRQLLLIEGRGMRRHMDSSQTYGLYIRIIAGWQVPVLHTSAADETAQVLQRIYKQDTTCSASPIKPRPPTLQDRHFS